jgi:hypothetical protein
VAKKQIPNSNLRNVFIEGSLEKYEKARRMIDEIVEEHRKMHLNFQSLIAGTHPIIQKKVDFKEGLTNCLSALSTGLRHSGDNSSRRYSKERSTRYGSYRKQNNNQYSTKRAKADKDTETDLCKCRWHPLIRSTGFNYGASNLNLSLEMMFNDTIAERGSMTKHQMQQFMQVPGYPQYEQPQQ